MEKFITATASDVAEEDIKVLCEEIFNKQIKVPFKDLHVIQLRGEFSPEFSKSESGNYIMVIKDLLIIFKI